MRIFRLLITVFAFIITVALVWSTSEMLYDHRIRPPDLVVMDTLGNERRYNKDTLTKVASAGVVLGPFQGPVRLRASRRYITEIWVPHPEEDLGSTVWRQKPDCQLGGRGWAKLIGHSEAMYRVRLSPRDSSSPLLVRILIWPPTDTVESRI